MRPKVVFRNVSKRFVQSGTQKENLKNLFFKRNRKEFQALNDVSFTIMPGETVGIIGINGSGKSTISNIASKVIPPTTGKVFIDGQPSIISISAGLNASLTGKENVYLKCLMMGLSRAEIDRLYPSIVDFSEIGDFIDQPLKTYSSGMKSRLGFAISVHIEPDVLIIDEALSVGDQTFGQKCAGKIDEFKEKGKTILFVSHSLGEVKKICDRVMWIHSGEIIYFGESKKVIEIYTDFTKTYTGLSKEDRKKYTAKILAIKNELEESTDIHLSRKETLRDIRKKGKKKKRRFPFDTIVLTTLTMTILLSAFVYLFGDQILSALAEDEPTEVVAEAEDEEVEEPAPAPVVEEVEGLAITFESDHIVVQQGSTYDLKVGMTIHDDIDSQEYLMDNTRTYADPVFDINVPGVYEITYVVTNSRGETAEAVRTFEVVPASGSDTSTSSTDEQESQSYDPEASTESGGSGSSAEEDPVSETPPASEPETPPVSEPEPPEEETPPIDEPGTEEPPPADEDSDPVVEPYKYLSGTMKR